MIGRVVLGRYRIVAPLAKGGMGVVYLARSEGASGFTKPVVVKRMVSDMLVDESMARMFVREARLMSRLRHPGLVMVTDFGEAQGDYLMVIEYVHGFHLGQWHRFLRKRHRPFPVNLAVFIVAEVLEALHYAHELCGPDGEPLHIVHRDVSPSNVLIDVEGHVKLADFGVARSREQTEKTEASTIKGKMPYLAPELFELAEPTPGADAYACGVVLHELLVGKNEFRAKDVAATVTRVLEHRLSPIDAVRDDAPDGLGDIVAKATARAPGARFQTAAELSHALRALDIGTQEALQTELRRATKADFLHDDFAVMVKTQSLADRADAWQDPSPEVLAPMRSERPSSSPPTVAAKTTGEFPALVVPARATRAPWLWVALLLVVLGGGVGAFAYVQGQPSGQGQQGFVVVSAAGGPRTASAAPASADAGQEAADAGGEAPTAAVPRTERSPGMGMNPPERPPSGNMRTGGGGRHPGGSMRVRRPRGPDFQGPFARQQPRILACYRQHEESGNITVVFRLAADGRISSTRVRPASVASTPFGQCIVRAAGGVRFPAPGEAVTLRFPVSVRRR